jgi:hypothetical protein
MAILKLTDEQIENGADSLEDNKLTPSQVEDIVSIFRGFLWDLADNYELEETLTALEDSASVKTCAKLAACLQLFNEEIAFDNGGFAATLANKTGFNYSLDTQEFKIFKYAFGLLWTVPIDIGQMGASSGHSEQGYFVNTL